MKTLKDWACRVAHEVLLEPLDVSAPRIAAAIREAVEEEREACARIADEEARRCREDHCWTDEELCRLQGGESAADRVAVTIRDQSVTASETRDQSVTIDPERGS